jgi:hypothetical protein
MAIQDYSNASPLLRGTVSRGVVDPTSRPIDMVRLLQSAGRFVPVASIGGAEPFEWSIVSSTSGTAERFVEGQALPAGSRRAFVNATQSAFYFRDSVKVTGRARDIAAAGGFVGDDLMSAEIASATSGVMYLIEQSLCGSTVNLGLASIVDDTALYGGLDPATYTVHASAVTTSVGTLSAAKMQDHYELQYAAPYNALPKVICTTVNQIGNYLNIAGLSGGTNVTRLALGQSGYDVGINPAVASYNGIPIVKIAEMTNTEMLWLDPSQITIAVQRDLTFEPLAKVNDDTVGMVSMALFPVVMNRRTQSKMEGITA